MQSMAGADPSESPGDAIASDESRAASSDARADADRAPVAAAATPSPVTAPTRSPAQSSAPAAPAPHAAPAPNDRTVSTSDDPTPPPTSPRPSGLPSPDDPTRTSTGLLPNEPPVALRPREDRLPAPLQIRDPDRYQIINEHGRGGLGRVFRARDKELGRDVAVKELLHRGNTAELRFFREALITARLEHPGIVPVHEAGRWPDGTPFYAMKLVQGRPLKALIDECKTLEDRLALLPHIIAVADAIAYAHDRKIIHRDLKPSNVIVGDFGETVVIDWGLAKDLTDEVPEVGAASNADGPSPSGGPYRPTVAVPEGLTVAGSVLGTPAYMAPEQARGEPVDHRADVFAIGILLHHALSSTRSSSGPLRIPAPLVSIIKKACQPLPQHRYSSAKALGEDLRRFVDGRSVSSHQYSLFERVQRPIKRHRWAAIAAGAALLVVSGVSTASWLAVTAEQRATSLARTRAEQRADDLTLAQSGMLAKEDPAEALSLLASFRGSAGDWIDAMLLAGDLTSRPRTQGRLDGHLGRITNLFIDPSSQHIVTTSTDGTARQWTAPRDHATSFCRGLSERTWIRTYEDSTLVVATDGSPNLLLCRLDSAASAQTHISLDFTPEHIAISKQLTFLYAASEHGAYVAIDLATGIPVSKGTINEPPIEFLITSSDHVIALSLHTVFLLKHTSNPPIPIHSVPLSTIAAATTSGDTVLILDTSDCAHEVTVPVVSMEAVPLCATSASLAHSHDRAASAVRVDPRWRSAIVANGDHAAMLSDTGIYHVSFSTKTILPIAPRGDALTVALSPDGTQVLTGHQDGRAIVHDTDRGWAASLSGHQGFVIHAGFITDGGRLVPVTAGQDFEPRLWALPTMPQRTIQASAHPIFHLQSLDDASIVMDAKDGVIRHLALPSADAAITALSEHASIAFGLAVDANTGRIATAGWDGYLRILARSRATEFTLHVDSALEYVAFSTDGRFIAAGGITGDIYIWDISNTPTPVSARAIAHQGPLSALAFAGDSLLITTSIDGAVATLDLANDESRRGTLETPASTLATGPGGRLYAIGERSGSLHLYDRQAPTNSAPITRKLWTIELSDWISSIQFSPNGDLIVAGTRHGHVHIVDVDNGSVRTTRPHKDYITDIEISKNGTFFSSACQDGTIRITDSASLRSIQLMEPDSSILSIQLSRDEKYLVASHWSGRISIWALPSIDTAPPADPTLIGWLREAAAR